MKKLPIATALLLTITLFHNCEDKPVLPSITTKMATDISTTTALSGGNLIDDGGASIDSAGVCWSTAEEPTTEDNRTVENGNLSSFTSNITQLSPNTTYYIRAYATNSAGTAYGKPVSFTTYGAIDIEKNGYKTVTIGTQTWFSTNLKSSKYSNGDIIETTTAEDIANESNPKYQWTYTGNEGWVSNAGKYYTWYAATDSRNICPTGWHVPGESEFHTLIYYLYLNGFGYEGSGWDIAKSLAATSGWREDLTPGSPGNDQAKNNITGFTAIPAGFRHFGVSFMGEGQNAVFWTSTSKDEPDAYVQQLGFQYGTFALTYYNKKNGVSIRCLKD